MMTIHKVENGGRRPPRLRTLRLAFAASYGPKQDAVPEGVAETAPDRSYDSLNPDLLNPRSSNRI